MKALSLFAGGGGADLGMIQAGLTMTGAVEIDPEVAEVYHLNIGDHITVADIRSLHPADFAPAAVIWASPPCPNFSIAKQGGKESKQDIELAEAVAKFVACLRPNYFFLENVYQYRKSESWARIRQALNAKGYWLDLAHVNAADMGVPQTRRRMIVRAALGQMVPHLPPPEPWVGWYSAIADMIVELKPCPFAPWQLKHLEPLLETTLVSGQYNKPAPTITTRFGRDVRAFVTSNNKMAYGQGVRWEDQPAFTVTTRHTGIRAMLISGDNQSSPPTIRPGDKPSFTIRNTGKGTTRAWLEGGNVVKLSHRCLARFQTFPDSYVLPDKSRLAGLIIGNAVPPLLAEKIVKATIPLDNIRLSYKL